MNRIKLWFASKQAKIIGLSALTLVYLAGIVCLFFNTQLGVLLWGVALVPSIILFIAQKRNERINDVIKAQSASDKPEPPDA